MKRVPEGKKKKKSVFYHYLVLSIIILLILKACTGTGLGQVPLGARPPPAPLLTCFASRVPGDLTGVGHFCSPLLTKPSKALTSLPAVTRQMSTNEALAGPVPR